MMKEFVIVFFLLNLFFFNSEGQIKKECVVKIESYFTEMEKIGFNGAVLVGESGEEVISNGYGFSNIESKTNNTSATIFDIGSITKQFTAAAIMKLEADGKLTTSDHLTKYFDSIPSDKTTITIHDLLRHQSGLISNVGNDYDPITREEFLVKVFSSTLKFDVGTDFAYSNVGYSLLAMIIEKVSGKSYENYLYDNLWKPSGMEMTGYSRPDFDPNLIATGYLRDDESWGKPTDKEWDTNAPYWHLKGNGGILSTSEDLFKWHQALMSDKILSDEVKYKMYHPQLRENETKSGYYAYGWDVSVTNRNTSRVWHNGTNHIFYADFLRFIDEDIVLILLSNKSHPYFDGINQEISKMIFNPGYVYAIPVADNEVNRNFTNEILDAIRESGLSSAKEHYAKKKTDEQLLEFSMRNEGFNAIDNNQPDIAIQIFEMNVFANPGSAKALQGLAEGYMETGKNELALKYFKESLNIQPENPFVVNLINKLEQ